MSALEAVLGEAKHYLGTAEQPHGSNRGVEVDYWIKECGLDPTKGYAWCAAWIGQMGRQAVGRWQWPVPATASCEAIFDWATTQRLVFAAPAVGDLFLLWEKDLKPAPRFGHTGFVTALLADGSCKTIEGNTNGGGGREGFGVFERTRRFVADDRFVRWAQHF